MTATIKRADRRSTVRRRRVRFSSLESLGFTDVARSWSDSPIMGDELPRGRHLAEPPKAEEMADQRPQEFGRQLAGPNVRWGMITLIVVVVGGLAAFGYWLSGRPAAVELSARIDLATKAETLQTALPLLTELNRGLRDPEPAIGLESLDSVESVARDLFTISGSIAENDLRSAASQAASSTLDGIRLIRGTYAYRSAVLPILNTPILETDRDLITLDEAARSFGTWQLAFDNVRTALPDEVLSAVTQQLDILSAELTSFLGRYVDALRQDDRASVESVLFSLGARLDETEQLLWNMVDEIHARVQTRIDETVAALKVIPQS